MGDYVDANGEGRNFTPQQLTHEADRREEAAAAYVPDAIKGRLEYLRGEIQAERISYEEIAELQHLAEYIDPDDTDLLQWATDQTGGE